MSRRRDHRVRMDASQCPDPDGCARLYHRTLGSGQESGDCCECCGQEVDDSDGDQAGGGGGHGHSSSPPRGRVREATP